MEIEISSVRYVSIYYYSDQEMKRRLKTDWAYLI